MLLHGMQSYKAGSFLELAFSFKKTVQCHLRYKKTDMIILKYAMLYCKSLMLNDV